MPRRKEPDNSVQITLTVNRVMASYLDWMARQGWLGGTREEVATFMLIREADDRLRAEDHKRIVEFRRFLKDEERRNA